MGKVSASHGWHWVGQAVALARRFPAVFPVMGLVMSLIAWIPWIGGPVLLFLGPSLIAGTIVAARQADTGGKPGVGDLFARFREGERLGPTLALCLPIIGGQLLGGLTAGVALVSAMHRAGIKLVAVEQDPQKLASLVDPALLGWIALAVIIMLAAYGFLFTAIARVSLDKQEAMPAMGESIRATGHHFGAWLVMMLTLFLSMFIPACIGLLIGLPSLASLLVYAVLYTLLGPTLYFAWRDLFGPRDAAQDRQASSGTPQPPPPSFEA